MPFLYLINGETINGNKQLSASKTSISLSSGKGLKNTIGNRTCRSINGGSSAV